MKDWSAFAGLSDHADVWIHGFAVPLSEPERRLVEERLALFTAGWKTHARTVRSRYAVVEDRFLVVAAESPNGVSGCSVDGLYRELRALARDNFLSCLDTSLVFYRDRSSQVHSVAHLDFFGLVAGGEVTAETPVFDTTLRRLADLRAGRFERTFAESWHARVYES